MTLSYGLVHSAASAADPSTTVTGLLLFDDDAEKWYILEIPTSVTISEGKVTDDMNITEIDYSTVAIVTADVPLEDKSVTPTLAEQTITCGTGYVGLGTITVAATPLEAGSATPTTSEQTLSPTSPNIGFSGVTVAAANLESLTVKSNAKSNQTKNPTSPAIGFSSVTVQKFDGESGNPESEYADGDEILIKLPSKYENLVDRIPEFNGYYKAVVSDSNVSYAYAQIMYADDIQGPRIPMFDLIGKVEIVPAN